MAGGFSTVAVAGCAGGFSTVAIAGWAGGFLAGGFLAGGLGWAVATFSAGFLAGLFPWDFFPAPLVAPLALGFTAGGGFSAGDGIESATLRLYLISSRGTISLGDWK